MAIARTRTSGNTDGKAFDKRQLLAALIDYRNWLAGKKCYKRERERTLELLTGVYIYIVVIYVGLNIALASYAVFLPTIIRDMGFSSLNAQLLSIPPYVAACILVFVSLRWLTSSSLYHLYYAHALVCFVEFGSNAAARLSHHDRGSCRRDRIHLFAR